MSTVLKRNTPTICRRLTAKLLPNFVFRGVSRSQRNCFRRSLTSQFYRPEPLLFFQVAPHLSSQGLSGPRSRPTATQNIWCVRRLLVTADVPSSPILLTLMMEALRSSETSVFTRATRRNIPEDAIVTAVKTKKSYIALTGWTL
jgi:hypothetical protein